MAFNGWPDEALAFFAGLEADNSRAYWIAHKTVYEERVRTPMQELLAELETEFGGGKIFRPNRDMRFSRDKSPYKTAIAATLERGGYIQLSASGLTAGSGIYHMAPDQLDRYRRAVADDMTGAELVRLIKDMERHRIELGHHERLRSAPRGYPKDHPRVDLLCNKGLIAWQHWPAAAWLATAATKERVLGFLHRSRPLAEWLDTNVGATTMPTRER